jgi:hypothetical protein
VAAQTWWLVSSSTENGKPWNVITFQGSAAAAKGEGINVDGYPHGPYPSAAAAVAAGKKLSTPVINDPAASSGNPITANGNLVTSSASSLANSTGIGSFLSILTNSGTWIRVAKVAIGGVLVVAGLVKMTGAGKAIEKAVVK